MPKNETLWFYGMQDQISASEELKCFLRKPTHSSSVTGLFGHDWNILHLKVKLNKLVEVFVK